MLLFYFATFVYRFHVAGEFAFVYTTHEKQPYPQWDIGSLSILDPMIFFTSKRQQKHRPFLFGRNILFEVAGFFGVGALEL